jgi:hypothetical protein
MAMTQMQAAMQLKQHKRKVIYGKDWNLIANGIKAAAHYTCQDKQCQSKITKGNKLTIHHKDGCPRNNEKTNREVLCQARHLYKQKFLEPCKALMQAPEMTNIEEIEAICQTCPRHKQF